MPVGDTTRQQIQRSIEIADCDPRVLFGQHSVFLSLIEARFSVHLTARGDEVTVVGEPNKVHAVERLFADLIRHVDKTGELSERYLHYAMTLVSEGMDGPSSQLETSPDLAGVGRQRIVAKTLGQKAYLEAIENYDITFCIGPAGTGKTYLAVAMAVAEWKAKLVNRVFLARPAVEAGESLGFLPGDIRAKVDPYLRPVYDALHEMMTVDKIQRLMENGTIEIVPLAFMRGRTLNHSFIILDEAQNTTPAQMKMFLTRLGERSKAVITGDITQIDLDKRTESGLVSAHRILSGIKGIGFVNLTDRDVVRHRLVSNIIRAYEHHEQGRSDNDRQGGDTDTPQSPSRDTTADATNTSDE
ncbi:MAG: AAA family ATPase [candidate division Zixibacteria bacterium]|nr:AAA family ATPase [candidate division Zixibacteria bacterium]